MRVLMINKFNYVKGGGAKYFLELAELLKNNGVEVAKFSMRDKRNVPDENEEYFVENIDFGKFQIRNTFRYLSRIFFSWEAYRKFEKIVQKFKPDIIHIHNIYHHISPSILFVAKKHKIPVVMHLHAYKLICPNYKLFNKGKLCEKCQGGKYYNCTLDKCVKNSYAKSLLGSLEAYLHNTWLKSYAIVSVFIAPSRFMKDISARFGMPAEKIRVIYNYTENKRKEANAGGDYLLYFGRLSEEKGVDVVVRAMAEINDKNIKLKIAGDGPEKNSIEKLVLEKGLAGRVEILEWAHDHELENLIAGAKAVVLPSLWNENMPLAMLEAMERGKIIVASRIGGMPEIIQDGENGFLFAAGDKNDLAAKIDGLGKFDLEKIGDAARRTMVGLNKEKHLREILEVYNGLLKAS